jgi:hypothetical protein
MMRIGIEDESVNCLGRMPSRGKLPFELIDALAAYPIAVVNEAFENEIGGSAREGLGRSCRCLQGRDNAQPDWVQSRQALENGNPCEGMVSNCRKDTRLFRNLRLLCPIRNLRQRITDFVSLKHDVATVCETTANVLELRNTSEIRMVRASCRRSTPGISRAAIRLST